LVRITHRLIALAGHNWFRRKRSRPIGIWRCSWPEVKASHRWGHIKHGLAGVTWQLTTIQGQICYYARQTRSAGC